MRAPGSDDALLEAAQAGDRVALNLLVARHRQGVYRFGLRVCRTTEDAEDAVQETLWAATRAIKAFRGTAATVASWLFTMVKRECVRLLERRRCAPSGIEEDADDFVSDVPSPEDAAVTNRRATALAAAIADLDPLHREVVLLRDIQELSAPEAAARLGISVDALKSRLHRARVHLREHLSMRAAQAQEAAPAP